MLEVGQKLYLYRTDGRGGIDRAPSEVTVSKVGRKWASIDRGQRVDIETLIVDHGQYSSFERCYRSVEERENEIALSLAWNEFRRNVSALHRPPTTNIESIRQAQELLGIALTGKDGANG